MINHKNIIYLSIGENCLTDIILERHGLKSFSTPYSYARSNIDYAIALEDNNYSNLLSQDGLYYANEQGLPPKAVRSKHIVKRANIYSQAHQKGFEFTHHDVIGDKEHFDSYTRKIERMRQIKTDDQPLCFFYHYRHNPNMNIDELLPKIAEFLDFYNHNNMKKAIAVVFTQQINEEEKKLEQFNIGRNILLFKLHTPQIWAGKDENIFFAKNDDDLIAEMLNQTKKFINTYFENNTWLFVF